MYHIYKLTLGGRELLDSYENLKDAAKFEMKMKRQIRKGSNRDGVFADVVMYSDEYLKKEAEKIKEIEKANAI